MWCVITFSTGFSCNLPNDDSDTFHPPQNDGSHFAHASPFEMDDAVNVISQPKFDTTIKSWRALSSASYTVTDCTLITPSSTHTVRVWQSSSYLKISTAIYRKYPRTVVDTKPRSKWNHGKLPSCRGENEAPLQLLKDQEDTLNPATVSGFLCPNSSQESYSGMEKNSAGCGSVIHLSTLLIVMLRIYKKIVY